MIHACDSCPGCREHVIRSALIVVSENIQYYLKLRIVHMLPEEAPAESAVHDQRLFRNKYGRIRESMIVAYSLSALAESLTRLGAMDALLADVCAPGVDDWFARLVQLLTKIDKQQYACRDSPLPEQTNYYSYAFCRASIQATTLSPTEIECLIHLLNYLECNDYVLKLFE